MRTFNQIRRFVSLGGATVLALGAFSTISLAESTLAPMVYAQVPVQVPPPPSAPFTSGSITQGRWLWQRTQYSDGATLAASDPSKYTITLLDGGRISIQADCNSGSSSYTLTDAQLTIHPGAMTLVACEPGSQDTVFLRDLLQVGTYVFDGQQLVLNLRADSGNMMFIPMAPASLNGVTWRITGYNNGQGGVVSVVEGTLLTAIFGDDGTVSGDTGCNMYRGAYAVAGSAVTFGPLITTRRACLSDAASAQEQAFLAAISASSAYQLVGDRLTLQDATGAAEVTAEDRYARAT
jgi:heat shock protein HslJ